MSHRRMLWAVVGVLLLATGLRTVAFGQVPPGLYHDEAYHGLDAEQILSGEFSLYFPENNGREPLFIYLVAATVGLLGKSPFAVRLAALPIGLLTVAATAAMGRVLFSRRVGVLAAAVLAVTAWHVHLSRVGFRAVLLPLFTALVVTQVALGIKTTRRSHWLAAGGLYGLACYTYSAVRLTPVALAVFVLYAWASKREDLRISSPLWRSMGLACLAGLVVIAPLAVYTLGHPEIVLGRPGQVSIFNPLINGGDPLGTLWSHTLRTAGMFFVRGDRIWRHNVPWRPVFDPLLGAACVLGVLVAIQRQRQEVAAGFILIWVATMSLSTLLAEDAPHFLRAVGVLPAAAFLPALGLDWAARAVSRLPSPKRRGRQGIAWLILAVPLLFGLISTTWAYFDTFARSPVAGYWFQQGAVALAGRVNGFLKVGWDGTQMVRSGPGDRGVYLDPRLWEYWPTIQFLIAEPQAVTLGLEGEPRDGPVAVFIWPFGDWRQARHLLPKPAEVTFEEGPPSRGDRDLEPFSTYLAFYATPADETAPTLAHFSGGVDLLGIEVTRVDAECGLIRLRWRATAPLDQDYTVFLHYLRDGQLLAQDDNQPARGRYPTTLWDPGDVINDDHLLRLPGTGDLRPGQDVLRLGFWQPETESVLYWLDEAGNPAGDWIDVPLPAPIPSLSQPWEER